MPAKVMTPEAYAVDVTPWGSLTWFVSKALGNSDTLTVGRCLIHPGCANPVHVHPNCDEVLHVLQGRVRHSMGDAHAVEMAVGDTISVPMGLAHNATNIGDEDAICLISFSSAERKTLNE